MIAMVDQSNLNCDPKHKQYVDEHRDNNCPDGYSPDAVGEVVMGPSVRLLLHVPRWRRSAQLDDLQWLLNPPPPSIMPIRVV